MLLLDKSVALKKEIWNWEKQNLKNAFCKRDQYSPPSFDHTNRKITLTTDFMYQSFVSKIWSQIVAVKMISDYIKRRPQYIRHNQMLLKCYQ